MPVRRIRLFVLFSIMSLLSVARIFKNEGIWPEWVLPDALYFSAMWIGPPLVLFMLGLIFRTRPIFQTFYVLAIIHAAIDFLYAVMPFIHLVSGYESNGLYLLFVPILLIPFTLLFLAYGVLRGIVVGRFHRSNTGIPPTA